MTIYIASKTKHASRWRALRDQGMPILARWIDDSGTGDALDATALWQRILEDIAHADALILYVEAGETPKGALVEMGAALIRGVPIFWVGPHEGQTVVRARGVRLMSSFDDALAGAAACTRW